MDAFLGMRTAVNNNLLFAIATDDRLLRRTVSETFTGEGVVIEPFPSELDLLRAMRANRYDLVLIDARNDPTPTSALLSWRDCNADVCTPVIVLTHHSSWSGLLRWIDAGATDVVNRFDIEQIRFRVHLALQRRISDTVTHQIQIGRYVLQRDLGLATIDGVEIPLTAREFSIAWMFFSNPGKFLSRAQIAASVWGATEQIAARTLEQHIYKLRKKLQLSRTAELNLKTVYALGYKLDVAQAAQSCFDADARAGFDTSPVSLGQGTTRRGGDGTLSDRACDSSAQFVVTVA
ncbi:MULTISPECIES: response regulator transcription factor [Paraburkholderia]|uniref:DNA-binding response regulator n=1 Tax=Paraburkholderia nemoris TaxID=2793076 RepID=A0ABM8SQT4_9BURK|nr:response regulator transcription factor [Paraburkholderia nemoris]MBK3783809.1 response regulator transcription factor [Paraburkholderia aspalathi]MBK5151329.1 response regulator transcription factor [Burkholderia sp. R-69608]MCP2089987.1 DNA-binding response OmpR family regulator [Paraburkholderia sediminicola]MBK3814682.1 response regulator transcription factor [Paraburkholderia aspalathi]CAE6746306.1 hypothetical protein R75461_02717 [Paraburkholderia nemoris]